MKKLLSLPPNLVNCFHVVEQADKTEWFCTSDPVGHKLGSGGGTIWLLKAGWKAAGTKKDFLAWLSQEKRILLHAGGQSRRLPGYAPSGKILTPIPVFRWARGQKLNQNLLSLQLPLYEKIMQQAPTSLHTLIASGDVYIRTDKFLPPIPEADVICYGLWADPALAQNHGVFISSRHTPERLDFMLQKPSVEKLNELMQTHFFLMDIGVWLLSDKAVKLLSQRSEKATGEIGYYDLYTDFGQALGDHPTLPDEEINQLNVLILPLPRGEFYHYGTSRELISSTLAIQNLVSDQREIMHRKIKPHPAIFVQNAQVDIQLKPENAEVWIENSHIGSNWQLHEKHILTGIPVNNWQLTVPAAICIDIVPVREKEYIARPYGFNDSFRGEIANDNTQLMGQPVKEWFIQRGINRDVPELLKGKDIQTTPLFPICQSVEDLGMVIRWMIAEPELIKGKEIWLQSEKWSADDITARANLKRLFTQREEYRKKNWPLLARNYEKSVFYQLNLEDAAQKFFHQNITLPANLPSEAGLMIQIHDRMFRARVLQLKGQNSSPEENEAFRLLKEGIIETILPDKIVPHLCVYSDQIVWGRSPVRIDLAGGWTDTPPYCLNSGGNVVNIAIELNGQPPIQVYIKPNREYNIILRSIDLGAVEVLTTYPELTHYNKVGSPFSIPKAALALAGFSPEFSKYIYSDLESQLQAFGGGIEITLLAAIPAGSGLGTSSILAATILGSLSDFCGLNWDKHEICQRTLVLEQLLTSGGGWQDQYGGILQGTKLLQTQSGFHQIPLVKWLPDYLFTEPEYRKCHLLYYTGITRTAKNILAEIVRSMFLNETKHLTILAEMKEHALQLYDAIQRENFSETGALIGKTWEQNKALDCSSNPPEIEAIIQKIKDYTLGYKLPGAGGGGYLYMLAKDPEAAVKIRHILTSEPPNEKARFVEMSLSTKGLQISRS